MCSLVRSKFSTSKLDFEDFSDFKKELKTFLINPKNKEKRKRHLANFFFQRIFSQSTYFDFFTKETIISLLIAKKIAQILKEPEINQEILLLSLCLSDHTILVSFLTKLNISKEELIKNYLSQKKYENFSMQLRKKLEQKIMTISSNFFNNNLTFLTMFFSSQKSGSFLQKKLLKKISPKSKIFLENFVFKKPLKNIRFSYSLFLFFEQLMKISQEKYKTPIISTELIFLELLNSKAVKILPKFLNSNFLFYELKYSVTKSLYKEETYLKEEIPKNRYYFSYLFKLGTEEGILKKMIEKEELLTNGDFLSKLFSLRKFLTKKIIRINILKYIQIEIFKSVFINSNLRVYK